jgi:hypothetical protein
MEELKKISKIVLKILKEDEVARKNEMHLYLRVHETLYPGIKDMALHEILDLMHLGKIPNWESIGRARRKVQQKHPELKDKETAHYRELEEEKYKEFTRC